MAPHGATSTNYRGTMKITNRPRLTNEAFNRPRLTNKTLKPPKANQQAINRLRLTNKTFKLTLINQQANCHWLTKDPSNRHRFIYEASKPPHTPHGEVFRNWTTVLEMWMHRELVNSFRTGG